MPTTKDLQGKELELEIELLDVKRTAQETDEQLAEKIGVDSAGALRDLVRGNLERQNEYGQRKKIREQISALLTESAKWDLPKELLKRQSHRELDRAVLELRSSGFSDQEILSQENRLRQDVMVKMEVMLKEHFILERIAEDEEIEDHDADYDIEIARIASQRNDSPRRVRAHMERTGQMDFAAET